MEEFKFEKTWCDYLTPCPYSLKDNDDLPIMVGEFECHNCKYNRLIDDKNNIVRCYRDELERKANVILKHNSEEIRKIMEIIGWKPFGAERQEWLYIDFIAKELCSCDEKNLVNISKVSSNECTEDIDCDDNLALFLSIAAFIINEDTHKYKIFVTDVDQHWVNQGMWCPAGSLNFCLTEDYWQGEHKCLTSRIVPSHLASIDELVEICKNEENRQLIEKFYFSLLN